MPGQVVLYAPTRQCSPHHFPNMCTGSARFYTGDAHLVHSEVGRPHVHAVMAVEGDRAISGPLHSAQIGTWFARAYLLVDS
jgi:hypothetical protein